jgi:hypothetical protein
MWSAGHFAVSGAVGAAVGASHCVLLGQSHVQSELLYTSCCLFVSLPFFSVFCIVLHSTATSASGQALILQRALGKHTALYCVT